MKNLKIRSHIGKIGQLPRDIRNQVGRALYDGVPGNRIVAWLNTLPEVQAILASDFGGQPVKKQNLYKWKIHGYPDWLKEESFMQGYRQFSAEQFQRMGLAAESHSAPAITGETK
jgi:hypothetical protein